MSRLSTIEGVRDVVLKAKRANIDTLIVDVKPLLGEVLYISDIAPRLENLEGLCFPKSFDLLEAMIQEGHANGIDVHAAINVFSEGHRQLHRGPAFDHPEGQSTMYEVARTIIVSGIPIDIEYIDPWYPSEAPTLYTCKSGKKLSTVSGKQYLIVSGNTLDSIVSAPDLELDVPLDGCVLELPVSNLLPDLFPGNLVEFKSAPVFCSAQNSKVPSWGIFVNPIGPARKYELQIIEEITRKYKIDGLVFDRMRYPNLFADFGFESRRGFESWLGEDVEWPSDIFTISDCPWLPPTPGKYFKEWLEWRAHQIHDFALEAAGLARSSRPGIEVGVYVGSWYESYYDVGVNWGSKRFHPEYEWMTKKYNETGYAEYFDYICTGCYYPTVMRDEALDKGVPVGATVEASCELSNDAILGESAVYGSLYIRDYIDDVNQFRRAVDMALDKTSGVMLFDLVYLEDYGWWTELTEMLK